VLFSAIQAYEYGHAPFAFGGNTYWLGLLHGDRLPRLPRDRRHHLPAVCLFRAYKGHFTPRQHFGFEAAAWYWHFVDVVWLFLFVAVYVWGGWGAPIH
jgi:cytochrome c oxidase subunit III